MRRALLLPPLAAAIAVSASCTLAPHYSRPPVAAQAAWRIDYPQAADVANTRWWEQFDDPVMSELIGQALKQNLDLAIAAARVSAFIGQLETTRAQFFPQIGYSFNASRNRASKIGRPALPPGTDPYFTLYQGALSADWQIDLFGRILSQTRAARAQVYASQQGRRGVVLSVVTSVAASYIALRALDRQLEIANQTAQNYALTLQVFEKRQRRGVVSNVELAQVQSQYQQALAAIPSIEQQVAAQENLISVLIGRAPFTVARGKTIDELTAPGIPAGLPSALLERRPDILQAEQNLIAANANLGAARALYFPQLSLTGALGSISTVFHDFLTAPAKTWSGAGGLVGPIFTAGAVTGQVRTAEAARREALATYQRTVLTAFQETNDALTGTVKKRQEAAAQTQRAEALREYARLSRRKFDNGYASYIEVLYSENELFAAELTAVQSKLDSYTQLIAVYRAMGGGWIDLADQETHTAMAAASERPAAD